MSSSLECTKTLSQKIERMKAPRDKTKDDRTEGTEEQKKTEDWEKSCEK